jgi:hypothetical protein
VTLEKRINTAKKTYAKFLDPAETIVWADEFFSILTDARLVSFKPLFVRAFLLDSSHEITLSLPIGDIDTNERVVVSGASAYIKLKDGSTEVMKSPIKPKQIDELMEQLRNVAKAPNTLGHLLKVTSDSRKEASDMTLAESQKTKEDARAESAKKKQAEKSAALKKYGQTVVSKPFATKWVTIYSKGYVKVSSGMGAFSGNIEKLLDIFGETDITRKSGLGRTAGAVLTLGANVLLSPGQRGNVYLTITTDRNTHSIMWTRPDANSIRTMNEIVSAGKSAIARSNSESTPAPASQAPSTGSPDLATQLANLAQLRDSGVLSEEEFEKAKGKLLG